MVNIMLQNFSAELMYCENALACVLCKHASSLILEFKVAEKIRCKT
jgi:hypothetical protein